jgi:L-fucose isomerase-like protein
MRAHRAVGQIVRRYGADAVTIQCLMLKHRKPCISFSLNNGALFPSGCENDLNATLTLMLGRWLLDRPGFQHNPEFDTSENRYFASHCTCATQLHGPQKPGREFHVRPFFHQLPKTAALDVQWPPGEPVMVAKYQSGKDTLCCWRGRAIESPASPPTGGCATRVLIEIEGVADVCDIYAGPHPVLFCGDRGDARRWKALARMYRLQFDGNV